MTEQSPNTSHLEQQKAEFTEHMYQCSGRANPSHPMHGLFTGLWHDFCLYEAGPTCRDAYFAKLKAIKHFQELELQQKKVKITKEDFIPTLHD